MQYFDRANVGVKALSPYQAGKPIEELERELGIKNIIKLASSAIRQPSSLPRFQRVLFQTSCRGKIRFTTGTNHSR